MTTKCYWLQTRIGGSIYTDGRGRYSQVPFAGCNQECDSTESSSTPETRERIRLKAQTQTGVCLVWKDGGEVEFFPA